MNVKVKKERHEHFLVVRYYFEGKINGQYVKTYMLPMNKLSSEILFIGQEEFYNSYGYEYNKNQIDEFEKRSLVEEIIKKGRIREITANVEEMEF